MIPVEEMVLAAVTNGIRERMKREVADFLSTSYCRKSHGYGLNKPRLGRISGVSFGVFMNVFIIFVTHLSISRTLQL